MPPKRTKRKQVPVASGTHVPPPEARSTPLILSVPIPRARRTRIPTVDTSTQPASAPLSIGTSTPAVGGTSAQPTMSMAEVVAGFHSLNQAMTAMAQGVNRCMETVTELVTSQRQVDRTVDTSEGGVSMVRGGQTLLKAFMDLKPPSFSGSGDQDKEDPLLFLEEINIRCKALSCSSQQSVEFVSFQLVGAARLWFQSQDSDTWTWEQFQTAFLDCFLSQWVQDIADSAARPKKPRGPSKVKQLKDGAKLPEPVLLTDSFSPESVKTQASIAIKSHIPGPRIKWSEWEDCEKTAAWNEFKNLYTWTGDNESKAKSVFEEYGKKNYSHFLHQARKLTKREREMGLDPRQNPPPYLSMDVWQEMWKKWDAEEFKQIQVKNKSNRNSENVVYHTAGPRTFEEVKLKILEKAADKSLTIDDIDPLEFYERTHKKGNNFTTTRAQEIMERGNAIQEELMDLRETQLSQGQTPKPMDPLLDILVPAVGGIRKGRVTGCGSKKFSKKVARSSASSSSTYVTREEHEVVVKSQQKIMEMIAMLQKQIQQKDDAIACMRADNSIDASEESSN